jgi:hypothetical protein
LPVASVQVQCRRLLASRTQLRLADTLDELLGEALAGGAAARSTRTAVDCGMIEQVASEMRIVIADLRARTQSARAVALAERLVADGDSVLYGTDATPLRETLDVIVFLSAASPRP